MILILSPQELAFNCLDSMIYDIWYEEFTWAFLGLHSVNRVQRYFWKKSWKLVVIDTFRRLVYFDQTLFNILYWYTTLQVSQYSTSEGVVLLMLFNAIKSCYHKIINSFWTLKPLESLNEYIMKIMFKYWRMFIYT